MRIKKISNKQIALVEESIVFEAGDICHNESSVQVEKRSVWDDPVVSEFVKTGKRPEWDVDVFIQKNFPQKPISR